MKYRSSHVERLIDFDDREDVLIVAPPEPETTRVPGPTPFGDGWLRWTSSGRVCRIASCVDQNEGVRRGTEQLFAASRDGLKAARKLADSPVHASLVALLMAVANTATFNLERLKRKAF